MFNKLSYLNSNLALTQGYLKPALNNSAQITITSCYVGWRIYILNLLLYHSVLVDVQNYTAKVLLLTVLAYFC